MKWEALGDKDAVRHLQTAYRRCSVSSPNAQWTQRWQLFKAAVASSPRLVF